MFEVLNLSWRCYNSRPNASFAMYFAHTHVGMCLCWVQSRPLGGQGGAAAQCPLTGKGANIFFLCIYIYIKVYIYKDCHYESNNRLVEVVQNRLF